MSAKEKTTINVKLDIGEMWALVDYHCVIRNAIAPSIPKTRKTIGKSFNDARQRHDRRAKELQKLIDETWPK